MYIILYNVQGPGTRQDPCKKSKALRASNFCPGKLEEWKRLTAEAMHIVRTKDKGTLQYDLPVLAMPPA